MKDSGKSPLALSQGAVQWLLFLGAPLLLLHSCDYVCQVCQQTHQRDLDGLDLFAGKQSVTRGFSGENMKATAYDVAYQGKDGDICSVEGWFRAIYLTLRLKPGSLVHGGPPCGSFVWINAHTSGRRTWRPFGFASLRPYVRQANVICGRLALILLLATCRSCFFIIEQPRSSCMHFFPYFTFLQRILEWLDESLWSRITFNMGSYGAKTLKPTQLFGSWPYLAKLVRTTSKRLRDKLAKKAKKSSKPMVRKTISKSSGRTQVSGAKGFKKSQIYPPRYGQAVAQWHKRCVRDKNNLLLKHTLHDEDRIPAWPFRVMKAPYNWRHASLDPIKTFLEAEAKANRFKPQFEGGLGFDL